MTIRVAINGFGRIGRAVLRANYEVARSERKLDIVAINDLGDARTNAHLTEFDSTHGRFKENISFTKKYAQFHAMIGAFRRSVHSQR